MLYGLEKWQKSAGEYFGRTGTSRGENVGARVKLLASPISRFHKN